MILCPRCQEKMLWQSDYMCDEVGNCNCGNGVVSYYECTDCNVQIELTTDCQGEEVIE